MIIWLASYPRSGSKLLRMILRQCFGLESYNDHSVDKSSNAVSSPLSELVGQKWVSDATFEGFIERARREPDTFVVRTHEFAPPDEPAIYIVRDGRAALSSYRRFLRDFHQVDISLADLAEGKHWPGSWGEHVTRWTERRRDRTLIVRFEDLASSPPLAEIGAFLNAPIQKESFDVSFSDLRQLDPRHFVIGHDRPGIEEFERECPDIFWRSNGDAMRRLNYVR